MPQGQDESSLADLALKNPVNAAVLDGIAELGLSDAWLVSGAVFQSVWNGLTGRAPGYGILDYDVFYFDADTSWEAEDAVIKRAASRFAKLGVDVQLRNQARVHLWYPQKFGQDFLPVANSAESVTRFLAPCCAVGLRRNGDQVDVLAPFGLEDVFGLTVRRNVLTSGPRSQYEAKAARWKKLWPEITVLPWDAD